MSLRTGHTGLNVTDLDRSLAFYRDVLGFALLSAGEEDGRRYAFLGDGDGDGSGHGDGDGEGPGDGSGHGDGGKLVLTLWQQAREPYDGGRAGLHHLAYTVDSVDRVRAYEAALRAAGVEFAHDGVVAHREGSASGGIFFHDPDGTRLEISVPHGAGDAPAPYASAPTCGFF